jgi:putative endonuclease
MLRLKDGGIYVGSTNDLERRWTEHRSGNGGRTTAESSTIALIYSESFLDQAAAGRRERQLKGWSRAKKLALAEGRLGQLRGLAKSRD